jgi:3-methyl-2-oxobutanoate hydroxymethyltransferase
MERAVKYILNKKGKSKITMLTCYDYSFACILDNSGLDIILVGDSLANVGLGLNETRKVSAAEMLNHTRAVALGVKNSLVVADMPYVSCHKGPRQALSYARKFIECGAKAVKIEWFKGCEPLIKTVVKNKIPVMGHIGLTPQTAHLLGGYKLQGKDEKGAERLIAQAKILEKIGVFSIVLECIPSDLGRRITKSLSIPTIGIGAGKNCDGQVLVLYDLLGLSQGKRPKFVRVYKDLSVQIEVAAKNFCLDVKKGAYPASRESY